MDLSKLNSNEKLAVYGALAVVIGGLVGIGAAGLGIVAVLAAVGVLAVVFLPQLSPTTNLPGSKGSLLLILGGLAAVILVLGLFTVLGALDFLLRLAFFSTLFYLVAVAGSVVMAWAGWQEFQAEGGNFQLGTSPAASPGARTTSAPPPAEPAPAPEPADAPPASPASQSSTPTSAEDDRPATS